MGTLETSPGELDLSPSELEFEGQELMRITQLLHETAWQRLEADLQDWSEKVSSKETVVVDGKDYQLVSDRRYVESSRSIKKLGSIPTLGQWELCQGQAPLVGIERVDAAAESWEMGPLAFRSLHRHYLYPQLDQGYQYSREADSIQLVLQVPLYNFGQNPTETDKILFRLVLGKFGYDEI